MVAGSIIRTIASRHGLRSHPSSARLAAIMRDARAALLDRYRRLLHRGSAPDARRQVLDAESLRRPRDGAPAVSVAVLVYQGVAAREVVAALEGLGAHLSCEVALVAPQLGRLVAVEPVYIVVPDTTITAAGTADIVVIPGGLGWHALADDRAVLDWIRRSTETARAVLAVSTGSLLVAAAGLLAGERATGHWLATQDLADLGAVPDTARIVEGAHVMTAAGATAAVDGARRIAQRLRWGPTMREPDLGES